MVGPVIRTDDKILEILKDSTLNMDISLVTASGFQKGYTLEQLFSTLAE